MASIAPIDYTKKVQGSGSVQGGSTNPNSVNSFDNQLKNTSVFSMAGTGSSFMTSGAATGMTGLGVEKTGDGSANTGGMTDAEIKDGNETANNATKSANDQNAKAGGLGSATASAGSASTSSAQGTTAATNSLKSSSANIFAQLAANGQQMTTMIADANKTGSELTSLQSEVAELDTSDGTGAGVNSANSLQVGGTDKPVETGETEKGGGLLAPAVASKTSAASEDTSGNDAKRAELNSQIDSKSASISSTAASVQALSLSSVAASMKLNTQATATASKAKQTQETSTTTAKVATGAAVGFGVIAAAGTVTQCVSTPLVVPPPTTVAGTGGVAAGTAANTSGTAGATTSTATATVATTTASTAGTSATTATTTASTAAQVGGKMAVLGGAGSALTTAFSSLTKKQA